MRAMLLSTLAGFSLLAGCAVVKGFEQTRVDPRIDQVVDEIYGRICNLRYKTEQRFLSRNQIGHVTMGVFCKRMVP